MTSGTMIVVEPGVETSYPEFANPVRQVRSNVMRQFSAMPKDIGGALGSSFLL